MEFNRCKSFIKTMECAALGVPLFASDCEPYSRVMPKDQLFSSGDDLKEKLIKLKFGVKGESSATAYRRIVERQWKWLNSPCKEGDFYLKNYWLEDNLQNVWIPLFKLRQKGLTLSLKSFI